jgi:putative DNA methylase
MDDKRLIEDYLPIQAISAEASREKSVRKGHISTLHLWWARRPLVACRAAVFGALVPADWPSRNARLKQELDEEFKDDADVEKGRKSEGKVPDRATAAAFMKHLCRYPCSERPLKTAQRLILQAHAERLTRELQVGRAGCPQPAGGASSTTDGAVGTPRPTKAPAWVTEFNWPANRTTVTVEDILAGRAPRPRVLDMFAGGGAIPLEALRLGCEAYALDLNPVAHIIELCTLVYPQKYGKPDPSAKGSGKDGTWAGLAEEVRYWGNWVLEKVRAEIGDLYPPIPDPEYSREKAQRAQKGLAEFAEPQQTMPFAEDRQLTLTAQSQIANRKSGI